MMYNKNSSDNNTEYAVWQLIQGQINNAQASTVNIELSNANVSSIYLACNLPIFAIS